MQNLSCILPSNKREPASVPPDNTARDATADDWHAARQRITLYLHALDIPEQKRSEMICEALARAEQSCKRRSADSPAAVAMRMLRKIMTEQKSAEVNGSADNELLSATKKRAAGKGKDSVEAFISMPPLNRGHMFPVEIDRQPWHYFIKRHILRWKRTV